MKKILFSITALVLTVTLACAAGCASGSQSQASDIPYDNAVSLLTALWDNDNGENKPKIVGGVGADAVMGEPGALDLGDPAAAAAALFVPEEMVASSISGASIMNAMMANAFCVSVWQFKDASDASQWASRAAESITSAQWMCTTPEVYSVYVCQTYVIAVFGYSDQVDGFTASVDDLLEPYGLQETASGPIEE